MGQNSLHGRGFAYGAFKSKQKLLKLLDKKGLKEAVKIEDLLGEKGQEYIDYLTQILDQKDFNSISKFVKNNKGWRIWQKDLASYQEKGMNSHKNGSREDSNQNCRAGKGTSE